MLKYIVFDRSNGTIIRSGLVTTPEDVEVQTIGQPHQGTAVPTAGDNPFVHDARMRVDISTSTVRDIATDTELFSINITPHETG
jgi:hypothetical protein